jgi:hypothetical protein
MKVKLLRNPGVFWGCDLTEGETGTVDIGLGQKLVTAGIAVDVSEPKPKIEAVPPKPAIASTEKKKPASKADKAKTSPQTRSDKTTTNKDT